MSYHAVAARMLLWRRRGVSTCIHLRDSSDRGGDSSSSFGLGGLECEGESENESEMGDPYL